MEYNKLPLNTNQHIEKLKSRGLIIDDDNETTHYLETIGYYRLSAYFIPFEQRAVQVNTRNHNFIENTHFDSVLELYIFDRKLRLMVMEAIERIEVAIRTQWANALAQSTNDPHAFMKETNFSDPWSHQNMLSKVSTNLNISGEVFVTHYKSNYQKPYLPPIWAMVETLTLGELSKWLKNTKNNRIKKEIAQSVGLPTKEVLESVIQSLSLIRNICAHHGRLWNRRIVKPLPYIKKFENILQKEASDDNNQPRKELFNYLVVTCYMMKSIQPTSSWPSRLKSHIESLDLSHQHAMGFPNNWMELDLFRPPHTNSQ